MTPTDPQSWPPGRGTMVERVRAHPWHLTPLGPIDRWPASLRIAVGNMLGSGQPMFMAWGAELVSLFNDAYLPMLGARSEGALGTPFRVLWADAWPQIGPIVERALAGEGTWVEDMPIVLGVAGRPETRWFTFSYSPLWDEAGRPAGMLATIVETTRRVREALERTPLIERSRRNEERLDAASALIEGITLGTDDLIAAEDDTYRYTFFNDAYRREFHRLWGVELEVGTSMVDAMAPWPEEQRKARELWRRALDGESFSVTMAFGATPELAQVYDLRFNPVVDRQGRRIGAAHILRNVTERVRMEEALADVHRRRGEFLVTLSHELRNPLAPLVNAHRVIDGATGLRERERRALEVAKRQTRQLTRLVDELLDASRIAHGKIHLRREAVSIASAVGAAVEAVAPEADARRQRLDVALPDGPVTIQADPVRVSQVLENLLGNAIKFSPDGGRIRVGVDERPGQVEIRVEDDGIGIESTQVERVFEMFAQADRSLERSRGGLGIGLAVVRELVELHGGQVAARSAGPGLGATFVVTLPKHAAA